MRTRVSNSASQKVTHDLNYFESNMPKNLDSFIWKRAAYKATKGGSIQAVFSAVRAIYNVYLKREQEAEMNLFNQNVDLQPNLNF